MEVLNWNILLSFVISLLIIGYGVVWFLGPRVGKRLPNWTGFVFGLLTILTVAGQWGLQFIQNRNYTIQVHVLSPTGQPLSKANVFTDVGGEATHDVSGWTVKIPGALLPPDGRVKFYALAEGSSEVDEIKIGSRRTESVTLTLSRGVFVVSGIVIDASAKPIQGAMVSASNGAAEITDAEGRFRLVLKGANIGEPIRLTVDKSGFNASASNYEISQSPITVVLRRQTSVGGDAHITTRSSQTAQQEVDVLSAELRAITMAPQIADQLRGWFGRSQQIIKDMRSQQWEDNITWDSRHGINDPDGHSKEWNNWEATIKKAQEEDVPQQFKRIIANADSIRKVLLEMIPPQQQTAADKTQEKEFAQTQSDPQALKKAADYLEDLARRVPPPKGPIN